MKPKLMLAIMGILVLASVFAAIYNVKIIANLPGFDLLYYECGSDQKCSNPILAQETFVEGKSHEIAYSNQGYNLVYAFKQGYLAHWVIFWNYNGDISFDFVKKDVCKADILKFSISNNTAYQNETILAEARIKSALTVTDPNAPEFYPQEYRDYFDADTQVTLQVLDTNNTLVYETSRTLNILFNSNETVNFEIDTSALQPGNYTVELVTNVSDEFCANSEIQVATAQLIILQEQPELQSPVAVLNISNTSAYANQTITFDASNSYDLDGYIVSYEFNFSDGTIVSGNTSIVEHAFSEPGNYTVSLTVTDADGLQDVTTADIEILPLPVELLPPVADAGPDQTVDEGQVVTFDASNSYDPDGVIVNYSWDFDNDGQADATGVIVSYVFENSGVYNVSLTVTDNDGLQARDYVTVIVGNVLPIVTISAEPQEGYAPLEVQFNCSALGNEPFGYSWDFGDNITSSLQNVTHTYNEAGNYTAICTVTDADGDIANASIIIHVFEALGNETNQTTNETTEEAEEIKIHEFGITSLQVSDIFENENLVAVVSIKNTGDYKETIALEACIKDLGICTSKEIVLEKAQEEFVELVINTTGIQPGNYSLEVKTSSDYYKTSKLAKFEIKESKETTLLLNSDAEVQQETSYRIIYPLTAILVALICLGLIIRYYSKIHRNSVVKDLSPQSLNISYNSRITTNSEEG